MLTQAGLSSRNGMPGSCWGALLAPHLKSVFIKTKYFIVFYHFIILSKSINSVVGD
jgi:hypothetical protein